MKFISKSANLHIILKPGIPAQPITGTPPVPTLSVRFQDGIVDVKDAELAELMQKHSGFNSDFIMADDGSGDPYAASREESEPAHINTELKYGTPVGRKISGKLGNMSPEMSNAIKEQAAELAKQMLPGMVKSTIEAVLKEREDAKNVTVPEQIKTADVTDTPAPTNKPPKTASKGKK